MNKQITGFQSKMKFIPNYAVFFREFNLI